MDLNSSQVSDQILKHDIQFNTDMNILSIGGSDPSSGAGIQSDIKTFSNHDVYGFTVVTAITSQNTRKVTSVEPVSAKSLMAQIDSIDIVFEEIKFSIEQLEEILTRKIDRVKDEVENLEDGFESFKRSTNRTIRELKQNISIIQDDINTLNEKVFPPVEEEVDKKKK